MSTSPPTRHRPQVGRHRYRVFLSSTFDDLRPYREVVIKAVRTAGYDVDPMEDWTADPREPTDFSTDRLEDTDVCILLVAFRRGFIPPGGARSITQQEYDFAFAEKIPILPLLLDEAVAWPEKWDERQCDPELAAWRKTLRNKHGSPLFPAEPEKLAIAVLQALSRWREELAPERKGPHPVANLPVPHTRFFGRESEVRDLAELLNAGHRLVTVLALGGYGKSRLALETARRLVEGSSRVAVFVDLTEAETLPEIAIFTANALGLSLERASESDPLRLVEQVLRKWAGILILDNFEQVVEFATDTVSRWSQAAPEVQFLVTSRVPLHLDGEAIFKLNPLPAPRLGAGADPNENADNPAVQLFADRARKHRPDFKVTPEALADVVSICQRVECQPLLIEIAASLMKRLRLARLVEELSQEDWLDKLETPELPFRKKEGGAALRVMTLSYELLSPDAQTAFTQAGVFRGGFDEPAARKVVELAKPKLLAQAMDELVDHCFLKYDPETERYSPYAQTLLEFGRRFWPGEGHPVPEALGERWAKHYLGVTLARNQRLYTARAAEALRELEADRENMLESQLWSARGGRAEFAADLMLASVPLLSTRGPFAMARDRLEETLTAAAQADPPRRCRLLGELCTILRGMGDLVAAQKRASAALILADGCGDRFLLGQCRRWYATVVGDHDQAVEGLREALAIFEEFDTPANPEAGRLVGLSKAFLGYVLDQQGAYRESLRCHTEAESRLRKLGNVYDLGFVRNAMGLAFWHSGQPRKAIEEFQQAERMQEELGNRLWTAGAITNRGLALTDLDETLEAVACFDRALGMLQEVGNRAWVAVNRGGRGRALARAGELDAGLEQMLWAEEKAEESGNTADAAMHAGFRGRVLCLAGRHPEAIDALGRSIRLAEQARCTGALRHMGNLAHYAFSCLREGQAEQARQAAAAAEELARKHQVDESHPLPSVAEGLGLLATTRRELGGMR